MSETDNKTAKNTAIGFIGLGDQGLPIAIGIAEAGYDLHVWARPQDPIDGLNGVPHVFHRTTRELGAACEIVGLCVRTDNDVIEVVTGGLLDGLRPGAIIVNHGTGTPRTAAHLAELCAPAGVAVLDAPVTGGRPAAQAKTSTVLVGGPVEALQRCEPVFRSFASHVVHLGPTGAGQTTKLFNNTLLMMNQAAIGEIVDLAEQVGMAPLKLIEALKLGSASSRAMTLLNTMVTPQTVGHLSAVQAEDMDIFAAAMADSGIDAKSVTARGVAGTANLARLIQQLNPPNG